jgi:hypothetical protein
MAGNNRFHNKFHRSEHHTNATPGIPSSATDPIASPTYPFQGDLHLVGSVSANGNVYSLTSNSMQILSAGVNLLNILTGGGGSAGDAAVNSLVHSNSGNWNSTYTTVNSNSASWSTASYAITTISSPASGNMTINSGMHTLKINLSSAATGNGARIGLPISGRLAGDTVTIPIKFINDASRIRIYNNTVSDGTLLLDQTNDSIARSFYSLFTYTGSTWELTFAYYYA